MFERFQKEARKVMALARKEAQRFNHNFIATEHILLGLIQEGRSVAANVLRNLGVEFNKIRSEIEKNMQSGPSMVTMGQLPFTARAKKVLELSMVEADEMGHAHIGSEHLLLGLLREHDGAAAQVLLDLGLKLKDVRKEVLEILGQGKTKETHSLPFTNRAMKAIDLACDEAKRFQMEAFDTAHILLGLIAEEYGIAGKVLRNMGMTLEKARIDAEKKLRERPPESTVGRFEWKRQKSGFLGIRVKTESYPFTADAEKSLQLAKEESGRLGYNFVGTEHILLAFLRDEEGIPARIMKESSLKLEEVRRKVLEMLSYNFPEPPIRAQSFDLVDAAGKVRARLKLKEDGSPALELLDKDGVPRLSLGLGLDGTPSIKFRDKDGKVDFSLPAKPGNPPPG